jgi:bacillithiol biosynthesis deacetylase BshB1
MKVDILAVGVHPDDIELSCAGTLLSQLNRGYSVALCDMTQGELGSRGSGPLRLEEAEAARKIFGVKHRENLGLADGFFQKDEKSLKALIEVIRVYQPDIVLANAIADRHTDHGKAADFIKEACFLSGLIKIETQRNGQVQQAWRPQAVYHYIQDYYHHPDFIVDISPYFQKKVETILAYSSQFYNPKSDEPETPISTKGFMDFIEGRARQFGRLIGVEYGEGFTTSRPIGVTDLKSFL